MSSRYSVLSNKEREQIVASFFTLENMVIDFSLTLNELNDIKKYRKPYIGLGYALQYLFLKNRNISILKTKYLIEYCTNGELRKEVQKMLNKGESINSVARLIFFGKQGRLNESSIEHQLEKVSCLNILLSALIIWNSRYLGNVYNEVKDASWFNPDEFKHVSPLGTQHINFLGRYVLENIEISTKDGLRELEIIIQEH